MLDWATGVGRKSIQFASAVPDHETFFIAREWYRVDMNITDLSNQSAFIGGFGQEQGHNYSHASQNHADYGQFHQER